MLFRFHRGGLQESLATIVELKTEEDILNHINYNYKGYMVFTDIVIEFYAYDDRIPANVHIVKGKYEGSPDDRYVPVGFVDDMDI